MENEKIQCLVSWKAFYANTRFDKYPAILCFPGYFRYVVHVIYNKYLETKRVIDANSNKKNEDFIVDTRYEEIQKSIINNLNRFLVSLQIMIDLIFCSDDENFIIKVKPFETIAKELLNAIKEAEMNKQHISYDFYLLEKYLLDENDRLNYQNALLQTSLKYHNAESVEHLIKILYEQGSCQDLDQTPIPREPISSIHYMHHVIHSNETPISKNIIGTSSWGPIYWNIFHTLPQNATKKLIQTRYTTDEITKFLYGYIQYLPLLLPCQVCTLHFYKNLCPDMIEYNKNMDEYKYIYDKIHKNVTENIQLTRKHISG